MAGGYWRRRAEANMDAVQEAASRRIERIGKAYNRAARDLTAEVERIIGKYADRFNLTRDEAVAILKQPFDRDSRAYAYRMSRAEALREAARLKARELGALTEKQTATQIAYTTDEAYRLARKALKDMGATASFADPDILGLTRALETGWKGASYSTRVWSNVERLAETLADEVTAAFLSGKSNARIAEIITERFGSSFREAERLVRTETSYVHNQAALQGYKDAGVEDYEYLTAHDSRTCKLCGVMDRKRFTLSEAEVGVNMPPMHPNCRCTVLPVFEGMDDSSPLHGRGEYGEDVKLPGDMKYDEYSQWSKAGYPAMDKWRANQLTEAQKQDIMKVDWSNADYPNSAAKAAHLKHLAGYGAGTTYDEYIEKARQLLSRPVSNDYPAIIRADDSIARFSYTTSEFVACQRDGTLKTAFVAVDNPGYWRKEYERN